MIPFEQASYLTKVRILKFLAVDALKQYPMKVKTIEFIKLSANAIFKVTDTKNNKYQLRIHPTVYHTKQAILEEIKWLHHILKTSDLIVPKPIGTIDGQYVIECKHPALSTPRFCDLFQWLPGKKRWKSINKKYADHLGSIMGQLQKNGQGLTICHRNYWSADGLVGTDKAKFWNVEKLKDVTVDEQKIITKARRIVYSKLKAYEDSNKSKSGLIHSDLQPNNILIHQHEYAVIDFDDCGVGLYGDDLAVALFAFEYVVEGNKGKDFHELKDALFNGYSRYMPFTQEDINLSPYFLLARKLLTLGWLELRRDNPGLRPYFHKGLKRAIDFFKKLENNKFKN